MSDCTLPKPAPDVTAYLRGLERHGEDRIWRTALQARQEIERLRKLLEAAGPAAKRYRYLRDRPLDSIHAGGVFAGRTPDNVVLNGGDLDAAIDAAMPCDYCDGTGDVHSFDGEWRGYCTCPAGTPATTEPATRGQQED